MPEGDTLFRTAVTLRKALLGKTVERFESSVGSVRTVNENYPVSGRQISAVEARGKNLLVTFDGPSSCHVERQGGSVVPAPIPVLVLHTHLRMTGSWHIYRPGEVWQKPTKYAKVVLHTSDFVVPCFSAPVVELLTQRQLDQHPSLTQLGPDTMTVEFDRAIALARIRSYPDVEIGVAIMNQRSVAGIGNIYKSEVLFVQRLSPFRKVGELNESILAGLLTEAHHLMRANQHRGERRTMFGLKESDRLWVYGRGDLPCRVCGEVIRVRRQGLDARTTYFCPRCQV